MEGRRLAKTTNTEKSLFWHLSLTIKLKLSNLFFCFLKQNLKDAQLDDAKQQMAFFKQTLVTPFFYSHANKSYIGIKLLSFPQL